MEKMIFGRFIPGNSFIHLLDPRSKLIFVFIFVIVTFIANNTVTYVMLLVLTFMTILLSRIRLYFLINGLKPVLFILFFTFMVHILLTREGPVVLDLGFLQIYEQGLRQGIYITVRFLVLVFMTSILTLTTSPISLTDGLEVLLNPLKKFKLPVHEVALMMSIALRFIPTLIDETDKIAKAQMARGSDLSAGSFSDRVKAVVPLLVPLFVSSFKRAEDLATAMEVRGYRGGEGRTRYRQLKWQVRDTIAMIVLLILAVLLLLFRS